MFVIMEGFGEYVFAWSGVISLVCMDWFWYFAIIGTCVGVQWLKVGFGMILNACSVGPLD